MEYWSGHFEAIISGPGGEVPLCTDPSENIVVIGGEGQSGRAKLFLRGVSPVRAQLSSLYEHQEGSGSRWGQNTIEIRDRKDGKLVLICRDVAFVTPPQGNVFTFDVGKIEAGLE
jgi:Bacteriophage KPP10, Structural protein ORF10